MGGISGMAVDLIVHDEADYVSDALAHTMTGRMTSSVGATQMQKTKRTVHALEVPCRRCGVGVGEPCTEQRRGVRFTYYKGHGSRKKDARAVTEAVRALNCSPATFMT